MIDPSRRRRTASIRHLSAVIVATSLLLVVLTVLEAVFVAPGPSRAAARPMAGPNLVLASDVAGPAAPGALARFSWTLRNAGDAAAPGSVLTVTWPAALQAVGASAGAAGLPGGNGLAWDLGSLAAGAERILTATLSVPVDQPVPSSLRVKGVALSAAEGGGGTDNHADRDLLVRASDLRVAVIGPPGGVAPGDAITHTVQVFNVGQGSAEGLRLDILFAAGLTPLRDGAAGAGLHRTAIPSGLRLTRSPVPGPWTGTFDVVGRVPLTVTSGMKLIAPLRLSVASLSVDADMGNNTAVAPTLDVVQPDLRLQVTGPPRLLPDDGAEYILDLDNVGTGPARGLVMTATLPAGIRFVSASPPGRRVSERAWVWERARMVPGDRDTVRIQARLDGGLKAGERPRLEAELRSAAIDLDPSNNRSGAESLILPGPPTALSLTALPVDIPVDDGRSVLTFNARDAFGNPVADGLVVGFSADGGSIAPPSALTVGGTVTATFRAGAAAGPATARAQVGALQTQTSLTLIPASLNLVGAVELAPGAAEAQPGDRLTYALTARNLGPATARQNVLVVVLERRIDVLEASSEGVPLDELAPVPAGVLDPPPAGYRQLAWRIPDLPPGAMRSIRVTLAIDGDPGLPWTGFDTLFCRAGLLSATAEANLADQRHQQRLDVVAGDLYTGIELNSLVSSIRPGGLLVYQITYGNAGQGAVARGSLTVTVPAGTHFESWEPTHGTPLQQRMATFTTASRQLVWDYAEPLARTSGLILRLTVDPEAAPERLLQTAVELGAPRYDVNPDNNLATDGGAWLSGVNLVVTPSGPASALPDQDLVWRIGLQNQAQRDNAGDVVLKAVPPPGFAVLATVPGGSVLPDGSVRWVVDGAMGPGAAAQFELRTRVPTTTAAGSRVRLLVEASSSSRDSYVGDNKRELELLVVPGPPSQLRIAASTTTPQGCDGSPVLLTARVGDAFGNAVAEGTPLRWQTAAGDLSRASGVTVAGVVSTTLGGLVRSGPLRVSATSADAAGTLALDVQPGTPRRIALLAAPSVLAAFGRTRLTGQLSDACGNPALDGSLLRFGAARGSFVGGGEDERPTSAGRASIDLDVGAATGPFVAVVRHVDLSATAEITVLALTPTPTPDPRRRVFLPRLLQTVLR